MNQRKLNDIKSLQREVVININKINQIIRELEEEQKQPDLRIREVYKKTKWICDNCNERNLMNVKTCPCRLSIYETS